MHWYIQLPDGSLEPIHWTPYTLKLVIQSSLALRAAIAAFILADFESIHRFNTLTT